MLAVIAHQVGRHDAAVELFHRSLFIAPGTAIVYSNFALALLALGRVDEAIDAAARTTQLKPDFANGWFVLGNALRKQSKPDEAIAAYRRAIELKGDYADAWNNLGNALKDRRRIDEAVAAFLRGIQLKPIFPEAFTNLGDALERQGKLEDAAAACNTAVRQKPDLPEAHYNLARALRNQQKPDEAAGACSRAVQLRPDYADAVGLLGAIRLEQGRFDEAAAQCLRALQLAPQDANAHNNLGNIRREQGQIDEALACYDRAMMLNPQDSVFHSNRLYALHFRPACDPAAVYQEHRAWNLQHAEPLGKFIQAPSTSSGQARHSTPDPDRRLKIGYVSADLWAHPVGRFLLPLLKEHDRAKFEVFCYADGYRSDSMTDLLKWHCDVWRSIAANSDEQVAERVRQDEIDILVDLAGHTAQNRLLVFARKPAPVQVTYLGYPDTTGMTAIDYRITDSHADPPGTTEAFHAEQLERLPHGFLCYAPAEEPIAVAALPALARGHVTFGSFNAGAKINAATAAIWARILHRLGDAKLMIKHRALSSAGACQHLLDLFSVHGIGAGRLDLRQAVDSHQDHLRMYGEVDIALDPFPYHGTTTTCEALWMGVPVVSLAGTSHVSRVGVSILSNAGLGKLVAQDTEEYVKVSVDLAGDFQRLSEIRLKLRENMRRSLLMDSPRFARDMENAYRTQWRRWCAKP